MNKKNTGRKASLARTIKFVFKYNKVLLIVVVACIVVSAIANLSMTLFMKELIDSYIMPLIGTVNPDFSPLAARLVQLAIVLGVGILCSFGFNRIMVYVGQGTMNRVRKTLFTHMESLPIKYFDTHAHGDIMSVYTNDVDTLRQLISISLPQLLNSLISLVSTLISMYVLNIPLSLIGTAMLGVMLLGSSKLAKKSGGYFVKQQHDLGAVDGYIEEMMGGQKVVKVFCHEDKSVEKFRELNEQLRVSSNQANRITNTLMPMNANIGNISFVICAIVGGVLALNGYAGLTVGTLVSFLNLDKNCTQPVIQVSQQLSSVLMASAGASRIFALIDEQSEQDNGYVELVNAKEDADGTLSETKEKTGLWAWKHRHSADGTVEYKKLEGDVTFDGVDFGYTDDKQVLYDIKMYATPGQKIAFVGSTGAGKTTITNLINRFYDIQDGKIRYDGININKIKKPELRHSLGVVLQDTHLFTDTVMNNIRYGRLYATDEECIAAAKLANAHGFIKRLPDGYNTMLTGSGASLSQGQRQLIAIARAAVADPPVLILDEATSSIDTHTEALVQKGMDKLMEGRTSFVIAHRLSTVKNADCIMVMEKGRIVERGTHDQLIEEQGRYYKLYTGKSAAAAG